MTLHLKKNMDDDMMTAPHLNTTVIDAALPWEDTFDLPNVDSTNSLWCEAPGNLPGGITAWLVDTYGKHPKKAIQNISLHLC